MTARRIVELSLSWGDWYRLKRAAGWEGVPPRQFIERSVLEAVEKRIAEINEATGENVSLKTGKKIY